VGGPTAILELGGVRVLTDPTFDEPGEYQMSSGRVLVKTAGPGIGPDQVGRIDAVLLSHDQHVDNLDGSGRALLNQAPLALTTASAAQRLGGPTRALRAWERYDLPRPGGGAVQITAVPAQHGPDGTEHLTGEVTGFVLAGEQVPTVYVSGDNASLDVVRAVAERFSPIDVAVLFVGAAKTALLGEAYLTLTSAQAAAAARILAARQVVPVHFNSWRHFTEGGDDLQRELKEAGLADRLVLLAPGEDATIDAVAHPRAVAD
jgi:L-ascorbate metabolism protein UlaG (beta-lactamase superfamily)